jgi:hypothetical protein
MGKIIMGSMIFVAGIVLTFIPPFIFGLPVMATGLGMVGFGFFKTGKSAAQATAAGIKAVQEHGAAKEYAERLAELEARERALAERETSSNNSRT